MLLKYQQLTRFLNMKPSRRLFLSQASLVAGASLLGKYLKQDAPSGTLLSAIPGNANRLIIYHTNGLNGTTGPVFKKTGGLGGINKELNSAETGFLLDAGNFLNNGAGFDQQKLLIQMMNNTGYKAAAAGGLDLSDGGEKLTALAAHMNFALVNCNHRFTPALKRIIKPYLTFKSGGLKIGITGVCKPLKGVVYDNAIACANRTARFLKENERCHVVICLSDLGSAKKDERVNDQILARTSEHIDVIIGNDYGRLHNNDAVFHNKLKQEVLLVAAVGQGLTIGKTVYTFDNEKLKKGIAVSHIIPGKPTGQKYSAALQELSLAENSLPV